jgi:hypothetical protein
MPSPRAPRLRRALTAAALCVAALGVWWLKGLTYGPFWGLGWVGWVPHEAWGAAWLGLALALASPHPRWRLWAAPWLALIASWPWVEPRWLLDAPLWQAGGACLGSAAALWTLWRCCTPSAAPSSAAEDAPSASLQRMLQGFWAARGDDPDAIEVNHSRDCALLSWRGLRVDLWGGGACVTAPEVNGGWPTANQRALEADAKNLGVTIAWEQSPPALWLHGGACAPLIIQALDGWATRLKPAATPLAPPAALLSDAPLPPSRAMPRVGVGVASARAVAAAALGICGLGLSWQALIFPVWEGAPVWRWAALGMASLIGVAALSARRLRADTAQRHPSLAFADAHTLRLAVLDLSNADADADADQDLSDADADADADAPRARSPVKGQALDTPQPRWRSLCPTQAPTPEDALRQHLGVCVTDTFAGVSLTLSRWPLPGDPSRVTEALTLRATDDATFGISYLRAALLAAAIPHEGRLNPDGGEALHLQATYDLRSPLRLHPWATLTRWWSARVHPHADPLQTTPTPRPALQNPWQHDASPALLSRVHAWAHPKALRRARRRDAIWITACALICASVLAMPRLDPAPFTPSASVAAEVAAAASRCPTPLADPSTPDTWRRLLALRCVASTTGQVGPLRRLDWEILSRPLQRLLEAQAAWSALQSHTLSPSCIEGAARLRIILDSPELRLSLAILSRQHPPTWRALHTPRPFFWPSAISQHNRAIDWDHLERWTSRCHHTLSPDDLQDLRTLYQLHPQ